MVSGRIMSVFLGRPRGEGGRQQRRPRRRHLSGRHLLPEGRPQPCEGVPAHRGHGGRAQQPYPQRRRPHQER